jgi:hypothetical protein
MSWLAYALMSSSPSSHVRWCSHTASSASWHGREPTPSSREVELRLVAEPQRFREPVQVVSTPTTAAAAIRITAAPSTSSEVDADPAAQPSTIQRVLRMPRSSGNRYLPRSRNSLPPRGAHAVDLGADRDNFRDSRRPDHKSRNLHAGVYSGNPPAVRWPRG